MTDDVLDGVLDAATRELDAAIDLRRRIHEQPELGLELPLTQAAVIDALEGLPLTITTGTTSRSVVAILDGDQPGPTVLMRGDMDALPMPEDTGLEYASRVDGAMHACGHDTHTAMLVGAAQLLSRRRGDLAGPCGLHVPARRGGPRRRQAHARRGPARPGGRRCRARVAWPSPSTSRPPSPRA